MTTNNHPANGPVSLERLHQISEILSKASAQSDGGNLGYAMADAVKVIDGAIAAFGAEPVPFDALRDAVAEVSGGPVMEWSDIYKGHQAVPFINFNSLARIVDKFRTVAPAKVVPKEITSASAPEVFEIAAEAERLGLCGTYASYAVGWNACRAAMLQAGNSPVNPDGNGSTVGKALTITLPDTSSKAFWSGTGKSEVFHPETYKCWAKEAIERACVISGIGVVVK